MINSACSQKSVHLKTFETVEGFGDNDFMALAETLAHRSPSAVLLSGGALWPGGENRYSIAAIDPFLILRSKGFLNNIHWQGHLIQTEENPLSALDRLFESLTPRFSDVPRPFCGGALGYFAYDLKNSIERLPATARDDLGLPDLFLFWPRLVYVHDRLESRLSRMELGIEGEPPRPDRESLPGPELHESNGWPRNFEAGEPESNFERGAYLDAVSRVKEYIRAGDIYQVNLSQRFRFAFKGDPFQLWKSLFEKNPSPFYAYINAGDHQILSTSMERFLYCDGPVVETRPIKGTRKRGATKEEDEALAAELLCSRKDDAELSMIVDLLRNDLGRVCLPRNVRVAEHKRLESYGNVHHLVSIVTGELAPDVTPGALLRATFPGGSITGCPKIRAMEIIDELEPHVRHVYTGSIGYIGWHGNLDLNVAIRTGIVRGENLYFSVGGGIVHDSDEEDEYQETLHKGRTLFELIKNRGAGRV